MIPATALILALLLCAYAWYGQRSYFALPVACLMAVGALYVPTGTPRYTTPPQGNYTVLGAKIVVDKAIYILLDSGEGEPAYYVLPYTDEKAGELQQAIDGAEGQGGVSANIDGEGGVSYEGDAPVTGDEAKVPQAPAYTVGG